MHLWHRGRRGTLGSGALVPEAGDGWIWLDRTGRAGSPYDNSP